LATHWQHRSHELVGAAGFASTGGVVRDAPDFAGAVAVSAVWPVVSPPPKRPATIADPRFRSSGRLRAFTVFSMTATQ
jgi:hypothetical protein